MAVELGNDGLPIIEFASREEFADFLEREGGSSDGVWARIAKKGCSRETATYPEVVEVCLAYGWIDSQKRRYDDEFTIQRLTPRRARSKWSRINRDRAEAMIAAGAMKPGGLAEVERAKADGRWEKAYEPPSTITEPDDLKAALAANPKAAEFYAGLSKTNRYSILWRVHEAKRPDTRARRIAKYVEMCERGETPHA